MAECGRGYCPMKRSAVAVGLPVLVLLALGVLDRGRAAVDASLDGSEAVGPDEAFEVTDRHEAG